MNNTTQDKMKGQKKDSHVHNVTKDKAFENLSFTALDLVPLQVTPDSFFNYLIDSGWIAAMVVKMDYYQLPNKEDLVDVYHDILLLIHERLPRLMEVYEDKGIMAALSYCKVITEIQGKPTGGVYGKNIKGLLPTIYMDSQVMSDIDNSYNPDEDEIFHMTSPTLIHPAYY